MAGMTVRFWGTRGSIPTPGRRTEKYGGNTACLEIRSGDTMIVLDAGSGIRELGESWSREFEESVRASLLLTHLHWDHIQGFPFFAPAYRPGNSLAIYGQERAAGGIRELLGGQMQGDYFPTPLSAMRARLEFHSTTPEFSIDGLRIRSCQLPHPGGSLGYRIESDDSVFVLATDCELDLVARNAAELQEDHLAIRQYDPQLLDFFHGTDLLVIDCQFLDEEYSVRRGWGHNSVACVVDLCSQVNPKMLALFHHDPQHTDDMVSTMVTDVFQRLEDRGARDMLIFAAREGVTMLVRRPRPPAKLTASSEVI
jgi:phosphoribosyl 1,2-cyclic phosphodiesterase